MSRSTATCAEKVERLAAIDWRSPMSANTPVKTGSVECGPIGGMMPLCAMRASKPTALMSTVLPPVFGPETRRSEEHTSELQSPCNLVCRLLLEKKKKKKTDEIQKTKTARHRCTGET